MEISEKKIAGVNIISLCGRLDAYCAAEVEKKLNTLIDVTEVRLVIGFDRLDYISSSGLRVLLAALKKTKKQQGDVRLAGMQPYIKEIFDVAGFTPLFNIFENETMAANSFGTGGAK